MSSFEDSVLERPCVATIDFCGDVGRCEGKGCVVCIVFLVEKKEDGK